jgi:ElaB/YqjD/DUF883 family membrane-anchored ribosome-binding protein
MVETLRDKVGTAYTKSKSKAGDAVKTGKAKANDAAKVTRATAQKAAEKTAQSVDRNPIAAVLGGLAIGVIAAALLPRTTREDKSMGKMGKNVRAQAAQAAKAAKTNAKDTLDNLGVNSEAARSQIRDLASKLGKAVASAGNAAADTVKKR